MRAPRFPWTAAELDFVVANFPVGGAEACRQALPGRSLVAIKQRAFKLGLKGPLPPRGLRTVVAGEELDRAFALHEQGLGADTIAARLGYTKSALCNSLFMEIGRRRGHPGAERDRHGCLTGKGVQQVREVLRKGWKGRDIQIRLRVSASTVSNERRRYSAYLRQNKLAPLPAPGKGERYSGAKLSREQRKSVEDLYLEGYGAKKITDATGVSHTQCLRIRRRLIERLGRNGKCLPGCDRTGKRLHFRGHGAAVPAATWEKLEHLLAVERLPVRRAAALVGMGDSAAYMFRDRLRARWEAEGRTFPAPRLPGKRPGVTANIRWLPRGRDNIILYRRLLIEQGGNEHEARRLAIRAIAERNGQDPGLAEQLDRMKQGAITAEKIVFSRRSAPDMTLGGVSSGML